jgi:hypothetical protein
MNYNLIKSSKVPADAAPCVDQYSGELKTEFLMYVAGGKGGSNPEPKENPGPKTCFGYPVMYEKEIKGPYYDGPIEC